MILIGIVGIAVLLLVTKKKGNGAAQISFGESVPEARTVESTLAQEKQKEIQKWGLVSSMVGTGVTSSLIAVGQASLAGPVGLAVAAVIVAFAVFRGTTHLIANEWVQGVQNPFGTALSSIVDAKDETLEEHTATKSSVRLAQQTVQGLWNRYKVDAEQFAQQGMSYRLIIDQSYETLDYRYFGDGTRRGTGLITRILADMTNQINSLPE